MLQSDIFFVEKHCENVDSEIRRRRIPGASTSKWQNTESGRIEWIMWGWMSAAGPGEMCLMPSRANGESYVEVMENTMLLSLKAVYPVEELPQVVFVHDNCPVHRAVVSREWFAQHPDIRVTP